MAVLVAVGFYRALITKTACSIGLPAMAEFNHDKLKWEA